jgi:hypothetical protein
MANASEAEAAIDRVVEGLTEEMEKVGLDLGQTDPYARRKPNLFSDPARVFLTQQCVVLERTIEDAKKVLAVYQTALRDLTPRTN